MCEWKRILCNKIWIFLMLAVSAVNLVVYYKTQIQLLNETPELYVKYTNGWSDILSGENADQAIQMIDIRTAQIFEDNVYTTEENAELNALNLWRDRLEYYDTYADHIHMVREQAEIIKSNPVFAKEDSFEFRNAEKTAEDYLSVEHSHTGVCVADVITSMVEYEGDNFFILIQLFITIIMLLQPIRIGMETLIRTTVKGRSHLVAMRILLLGISSALSALFSLVGELILGCRIYDQSLDLSVSIQSIPCFQNFTEQITIAGFLLWYFLFKTLTFFVLGLFFWRILENFRSNVTGVVLCVLILAVELILFERFEINDSGYWLASYNIMHFLFLQPVIKRYLNYNILGYPINERYVLLILLVISGCLLIIDAFSKTRAQEDKFRFGIEPVRFLRKPSKQVASAGGHIVLEVKKTAIYGRGLLLLVVGVLALSFCKPASLNHSQREELLILYKKMYAGPLSEETYEQILNNLQVSRDEYRAVKKSEANSYSVDYHEAKVWAYDELQKRYEELMDYEENGAENLELIDESAFLRIYGNEGTDFRKQSACIILLMLCTIIPLILSQEKDDNMKPLLFSTSYGRSRLWREKNALMFFITVGIWMIWTLYESYLFLHLENGKELLFVNALSMGNWQNLQENHTVLWHIIGTALCRLEILLVLGTTVYTLSACFSVYLTVMGIGIIIMIVPYFLSETGLTWLEPINCVKWLSVTKPFSVSWISMLTMISIISVIVLLRISVRMWKGEKHISFH